MLGQSLVMEIKLVLIAIICMFLVSALRTGDQDSPGYKIISVTVNSSTVLLCDLGSQGFVQWKKNSCNVISYTIQETFCEPRHGENITKEYNATCDGKQTNLTILKVTREDHGSFWTCANLSQHQINAYKLAVRNKSMESGEDQSIKEYTLDVENTKNEKTKMSKMADGGTDTAVSSGTGHEKEIIEMIDNELYLESGPQGPETDNSMYENTPSANVTNKTEKVSEENIEDLYAKPVKKYKRNA